MKHKSITIKGSNLMDRWENDNRTAADVAGLDSIDPKAIYEVNWPDHVATPRLNGDCEIRLIGGDDRIAANIGAIMEEVLHKVDQLNRDIGVYAGRIAEKMEFDLYGCERDWIDRKIRWLLQNKP